MTTNPHEPYFHPRANATQLTHPHLAQLQTHTRRALERHRTLAVQRDARNLRPALNGLRTALASATLLVQEIRQAGLPHNQEIALLTETLDLLHSLAGEAQTAIALEERIGAVTGQPVTLLATCFAWQEHVQNSLEQLGTHDKAYVVARLHGVQPGAGILDAAVEALLAELAGVDFCFADEEQRKKQKTA